MMVYDYSTIKSIKSEGTTQETAVHSVDDVKLLKAGFCMVMLDGRHRRGSVEIIRVEGVVE